MSTIDQGQQELSAFLSAWPLSRLQNMTLEEYTNSDRDTAFIYWLEKKTEHTGSIWGGSAFKFGIYKRAKTEFVEKKSVRTDGTYAWLAKYGETREEAFVNVKTIIIKIVEASTSDNLEQIDQIDLGDAVKWKIAFLYNAARIIPIFNPMVLMRATENNGMQNPNKDTVSKLHRFLLDIKPADQSTLQFAQNLWNKYNLNNFYATIDKFLTQAQTDNIVQKGYPTLYRKLQVRVSFGRGELAKVPWIAFLREPNKVLDGIYPVFLYFRSDNLLILAYGKSDTNEPKYHWEGEEHLESVKDWYLNNRHKRPDKYGSSYIKAVYDLNEELDPERIQNDLDSLVNEYLTLPFEGDSELEEPEAEYAGRRTWLIAPGEGAYLWEEFYEKGIAGVGWDEIGDLTRYSTREEIKTALITLYPDGSKSQSNNSLCLWQFSREMKPGDIVIAKRGTSEYIGYGIVSGSYYFDESRPSYKHLLKVDWKKRGTWEENLGPIVVKTLTDITKYSEYVDRLKRLIGIEQEAKIDPQSIEYYWLNANPKYWKIEDFQVGQEQSYTTHNEKGNKRSRFEYFQRIKPGDLVLGYETTPIQKVVAVFEVTQGAHLDEDTGQEEISFKIQKFLPNPVSLETLKAMTELKDSEVMKNNQGSLFRLTKEEFTAIVEKDVRKGVDLPSYTIETAEKEIFMEKETIQKIMDTLRYKKNIILQGPPGVGKTFMARRLAYLMMEEKDNTKVEMVQFHQSYSYEDFIQGYRPREDGSFRMENGVFYRFCKRAEADPDNDYFFIIDEINRGNLSKIFGELMLLLEADKRGPGFAVSLTYTAANENRFFIPENVYLIGTMNTADRSLAMVDYALRRRFAFIDVHPAFNKKFKEELVNKGVDEGVIEPIVTRIAALNLEIESDSNLRKGFRIGHSYFCNVPPNSGDQEWYHGIIEHEIAPLLKEYWFDNEEKAELEINRLFLK